MFSIVCEKTLLRTNNFRIVSMNLVSRVPRISNHNFQNRQLGPHLGFGTTNNYTQGCLMEMTLCAVWRIKTGVVAVRVLTKVLEKVHLSNACDRLLKQPSRFLVLMVCGLLAGFKVWHSLLRTKCLEPAARHFPCVHPEHMLVCEGSVKEFCY